MLKIDIAELEELARNLRRNSHLQVKTLPPHVRHDFRKLLTYVSLLYDSKQYIILHNIITKHFDDLQDIIPGSIGAYCAGCQTETSFSDDLQGCSAICAGSMPPKKDDWTFCNNTVVLATYVDDQFIFSISRRSDTREGRETAFVFVDYTSPEEFPGFNNDEKNQLLSLGIRYVYLNGYTEGGHRYIGLESRAVRVEDLKGRDCSIEDTPSKLHHFNDSGLIIFLIILVFIALFFAWRYWQLRNER